MHLPMEVICLYDATFNALVEQMIDRLKAEHNQTLDKWVGGEEAMRLLNIKSKVILLEFLLYSSTAIEDMTK